MRASSHRLLLGWVAVALVATVLPARAEERVVEALAVWQIDGRLFRAGPQQALFVGALSGTMFASNREVEMDGARIVCPGLVEIDLESQAQAGEGRCIITDRDSHRAFARWMCTGVRPQGCQGLFRFLGGTGKFQGISGESSFVSRGGLEQVVDVTEQTLREGAAGVVIWPTLRYRLP